MFCADELGAGQCVGGKRVTRSLLSNVVVDLLRMFERPHFRKQLGVLPRRSSRRTKKHDIFGKIDYLTPSKREFCGGPLQTKHEAIFAFVMPLELGEG